MVQLAISTAVPLPLSRCGAHMYAQGFGTWQAPKGEVYKAVKHAIESGYRLIDCAKIYRNQEEVGQAIEEVIASGICTRKDLYIVSKVWNTDHAPEHVAASTKLTVEHLKCQYFDLLLMHWPTSHSHAPGGITDFADESLFPQDKCGYKMAKVPIMDTYRAMEETVTGGLVRDIGLSNFNVEEMKAVLEECTIKPVALQIEVHPGLQQDAVREFCRKEGIAVMAYCPLGIGMEDPMLGLIHNKEVSEIAKHAGVINTARLLLQWSSQIGCVCLSKSVTPARIVENAQTPFGGLSEATMGEMKEFGKKVHIRVCNPPFRAGNTPIFSD